MKLSRIIAYSLPGGPILFSSGFVITLYNPGWLGAALLLSGLIWFSIALFCWIPIFSEMD